MVQKTKPKQKVKRKIKAGVVFVLSSRNSKLTETKNNKVLSINKVETYQIKRNNKTKKYEIYNLSRRKKPKRIKTIKIKKQYSIKDVRNDILSGKILIKQKYKSRVKTSDGKAEIIQTNYLARLGSNKTGYKLYPQLVGLVLVQDIRRGITDNLLGYSHRLNAQYPSEIRFRKAKLDIIDMAIAKFINIYGLAKSSGDLIAQIIDTRYQYWRVKK